MTRAYLVGVRMAWMRWVIWAFGGFLAANSLASIFRSRGGAEVGSGLLGLAATIPYFLFGWYFYVRRPRQARRWFEEHGKPFPTVPERRGKPAGKPAEVKPRGDRGAAVRIAKGPRASRVAAAFAARAGRRRAEDA